MALNVQQDTAWGRAAQRFADAVKYRTQGRIQIRNYFEGQLFAGRQMTEFTLLQQGVADFSIGSTVNWSPHVKELNLFGLPFLFPSYAALDAVQTGEPGKRLFNLMEQTASSRSHGGKTVLGKLQTLSVQSASLKIFRG